jgi:peptidoglycan/xylan/chitin deacetylase (PgdA/CDA1 family)
MALAGDYARWLRDRWYLSPRGAAGNGSAVVILVFHNLFRDRAEVRQGLCDPQQGITVPMFREFIETLLGEGVPIRDLETALGDPQPGLVAVVTFDDGYYNNVRALEILEHFQVPAVFFISTGHVEERKSFWWDAFYRSARGGGASPSAIASEIRLLKRLRNDQIEGRLHEWFGPDVLQPVADTDRPFTSQELRVFARSPFVHLGNHTRDHAILVNYSLPDARDQIERAQHYLAEVTGRPPKAIAYPNGDCTDSVVTLAKELGMKFGVTARSGVNHPSGQALELRRLTVRAVPNPRRQAQAIGALGRALHTRMR